MRTERPRRTRTMKRAPRDRDVERGDDDVRLRSGRAAGARQRWADDSAVGKGHAVSETGHLGSTRLLTKARGIVVIYDCSPFGMEFAQSGDTNVSGNAVRNS